MNRTPKYLAALLALGSMIAPTFAGERSVSAAEANGTYRDGKREIKIPLRRAW